MAGIACPPIVDRLEYDPPAVNARPRIALRDGLAETYGGCLAHGATADATP